MAQSLAQIHVHLVFSTKDRVADITSDIAPKLRAYLAGVLVKLDCPCAIVGGAADHVHLLFNLGRERSIAAVVEKLKTSSSKWIKTQGVPFSKFAWQAGYGAFSVSPSQFDRVANYIARQEEHHRVITFLDEFRMLLRRHRTAFDEKFVWG
jgi:putative transposase